VLKEDAADHPYMLLVFS